jgi:hypothetical protein
MQQIIDTITAFGRWLLSLVTDIFVSLWKLLTDVVCYPFDKLLSFASGMLNGIDVSGVSSVGAWGSVPAEIINMLGLLGFGQCMAIIATAITIRLGLQLIPFVRLGS